MGYGILLILVLIELTLDFCKVHEYGRHNLLRMASPPVRKSRHRKIPFGTRSSLSGR